MSEDKKRHMDALWKVMREYRLENGATVAELVGDAHDRISLLALLAEALSPAYHRLGKALERQCDNMAFVLNKATLPDQWYCKFSNELEADRGLIINQPRSKVDE